MPQYQDEIEKLANRIFGESLESKLPFGPVVPSEYVSDTLWLIGGEPYLVRHNGYGKFYAKARFDGKEWVKIDDEKVS